MIDNGMLWRDEPLPRKEPKILGVSWFDLPRQRGREGRKAREARFRRLWLKATDYGRHPPSQEFMARLPELLAAAQLEDEADKREDEADIARARELLSQVRKPPCESCLRPAAPCQRRCLRPLLLSNDPRVKARMTDALLLAIRELIQAAERKMKGDAAVTLSAQSIRVRCLECAPPLLTPFVERSVSPGGRSFGLSSASYDVRIDKDVIVPPHGFVLASTVERFHLPNDLAGTVRDKSSWARLGLAVQNTHLDPGWSGYLTLELSNHSDTEIRIPRGEPIAQIVFELLDQPTEQPYSGKYQDQERGPQAARHEGYEFARDVGGR